MQAVPRKGAYALFSAALYAVLRKYRLRRTEQNGIIVL